MGDFWKPTAEMFTSLFQRPKMAEKLLVKPPFKYIFDIITETTKSTGFANGLLTPEEQAPQYYESRQKKIAYLQKFIDLIRVMGKEEVAAKPPKIVAGLEPQLTNLMLQSMYKLAVSGNPSDPYIAKALGKEEAPPKKANQPVSKEKPSPQDKETQEQPPPPQENPRVVRPPSAPRRGMRPPEGPSSQQPASKTPAPKESQEPATLDQQEEPAREETQKQPQRQGKQYSQKVNQALSQNAESKEEQQPQGQLGKKVEMGNLRKRKNQTKGDGTEVISVVGQITEKELESVKALIQSICQNSTPLSKSIQFVNDDVQAMNQELLYWRKQYNVSKGKMQSQLKITEDSLIPLYDKLAEIEEQSKDQKGKIQNMKSQIIKNQATINALLYSVVKG